MLKFTSLLFGFCLFLSNIANGQNWKEIEIKDHKFNIRFSKTPEISTDTNEFENSSLLNYNWYLDATKDSLDLNDYYLISVETYPASFIHSDSSLDVVGDFLNSTQDYNIEDESLKLISSILIEKHGYPGKEFKWKNKIDNQCYIYKVYLIENRVYTLMVIPNINNSFNKSAEYFFDSFVPTFTPKGKFVIPTMTYKKTYSAEFPGTPIADTKILDSENGKFSLNMLYYESKNNSDNAYYVVSEIQNKQLITNQEDSYALNNLYRKSIEGSINSMNGELISITDIKIGGLPAKEIKCYLQEGKALFVSRILYNAGILYQLLIISRPEKDNNPEMEKFFNSFAIIK